MAWVLSCPHWALSIANEVARLVVTPAVRQRFEQQIREWALWFVEGWTDEDVESAAARSKRRGEWYFLAGRAAQNTNLVPLPGLTTLPEKYALLAIIHNVCLDCHALDPWSVVVERKYDWEKLKPHWKGPRPREIDTELRFESPVDKRAYFAFGYLACDVAEDRDWQIRDEAQVLIENMLREVTDDLRELGLLQRESGRERDRVNPLPFVDRRSDHGGDVAGAEPEATSSSSAGASGAAPGLDFPDKNSTPTSVEVATTIDSVQAVTTESAPVRRRRRKRRKCFERDHKWLDWYEAQGTETYHAPAVIRDKWNRENQSERISDGEHGRDLVEKGIARARKERGNVPPEN
jgi:hypothetical protein